MKKLFFMLVMTLCAITMSAKNDADTTVVFNITPEMHCSNCEAKIKNNLRFEKGVSKIEATAPGNQVAVTFNKKKTTPCAIVKGFAKLGYEAVPAGATTGCCKKAEGKECCKKAESKECCKKAEGKGCCK